MSTTNNLRINFKFLFKKSINFRICLHRITASIKNTKLRHKSSLNILELYNCSLRDIPKFDICSAFYDFFLSQFFVLTSITLSKDNLLINASDNLKSHTILSLNVLIYGDIIFIFQLLCT